jgi:hypothetical protein
MSRGRFIVRDGKLLGEKGHGRYISRGKPFEPSVNEQITHSPAA